MPHLRFRLARCRLVWLFSLCFLPLMATRSAADVITTGEVTLIPAPPSVQLNALQSDTNVYLFPEKQGITLSQNVNVDITTAGSYTAAAQTPFTPGVVAAGTVVNSWLVHFNPADGPLYGSGSLTFTDQKIVGIIATDANLDATDLLLGNPTTRYSTGVAGRGLEINLPGTDNYDSVTLSTDLMSLSLTWRAGVVEDEIRILTQTLPLSPPTPPTQPPSAPPISAPIPPSLNAPTAPEPATFTAWSVALAGLLIVHCRRLRTRGIRHRT